MLSALLFNPGWAYFTLVIHIFFQKWSPPSSDPLLAFARRAYFFDWAHSGACETNLSHAETFLSHDTR